MDKPLASTLCHHSHHTTWEPVALNSIISPLPTASLDPFTEKESDSVTSPKRKIHRACPNEKSGGCQPPAHAFKQTGRQHSRGGPFRRTQGGSGPPTPNQRLGGGELEVVTMRHPIPLLQGAQLFFAGWLRSWKRCKTRETGSYSLVSPAYCGHTTQKLVVGLQQRLWVRAAFSYTMLAFLHCGVQPLSVCHLLSLTDEITCLWMTVGWRRTSVSTHDNHSPWLRFKNSF